MPPYTVRESRRNVFLAGGLFGAGFAILFEGLLTRGTLGWRPAAIASGAAATAEAALEFAAVAFFAWGLVLLLMTRSRLDTPRTPRRMLGSILVGAGVYGLVEGVALHHVLRLHSVRPGPDSLAWDVTYLVVALVALSVGALILWNVRREVLDLQRVSRPRGRSSS